MLKVRVYTSPLTGDQLDLETEVDKVMILIGHEWLEYGDPIAATRLILDFSKVLAVQISPWTEGEAEAIKEE